MLKVQTLMVILLSDSGVLRVRNASIDEFIDNLMNGLFVSEA